MLLWSLSRNTALEAVVAKPYGKCFVSQSHQTVNKWEITLRLLASLNCLTPSGPHYYPVDGVCGFNVISKLFYCAYHKSLPEPLEDELVKLCRTFATSFYFLLLLICKMVSPNSEHSRLNLGFICLFVFFFLTYPEAKWHHNGRCRKSLTTAPPLALYLYYNYLIALWWRKGGKAPILGMLFVKSVH